MRQALRAYLMIVSVSLFSVPVFAGTQTLSSVLDGSEPTFDQPLSIAITQTPYDTYEFTVAEDGMYSVLSFYAGDPVTAAHLDGVLLLYEVFHPQDAAAFLAGSDDYTDQELPSLGDFDDDCIGANCSGFDVALTSGTTYILVQTAFTDTSTSFGQPTGAYEITLTGPGVFPFPIPASFWLFASALGALGFRCHSPFGQSMWPLQGSPSLK